MNSKNPYEPFTVIGKRKCKKCNEETFVTYNGLCQVCYNKKEE